MKGNRKYGILLLMILICLLTGNNRPRKPMTERVEYVCKCDSEYGEVINKEIVTTIRENKEDINDLCEKSINSDSGKEEQCEKSKDSGTELRPMQSSVYHPEWIAQGSTFICWKNLLIITNEELNYRKNQVYRKENGKYVRIEEDKDLLGYFSTDMKQWRNYIVADVYMRTRDEVRFLIYNMDTLELYLFDPHEEGQYIILGYEWNIYDGKIFYTTSEDVYCDYTIHTYDLESHEREVIKTGNENLSLRWWMAVRDDGMLAFEGYDRTSDCEVWYMTDCNGTVVMSVSLSENCEVAEIIGFNSSGLFMHEDVRIYCEDSYIFNEETKTYCLTDGGQTLPVTEPELRVKVPGLDNQLYSRWVLTKDGCFVWDDSDTLIPFYDFDGNRTGLWRLAEEDTLEEGWRMINMVYDGERLLGFYECEETGELYISEGKQIQ